MPISPAPGKGVTIAGLNKTSGWGSRGATGNLIAGHEPDQGINHVAGLSEGGLDTRANPLVTTFAVTSITSTGATITWTCAPASGLGNVVARPVGGAVLAQVNETGTPPLTSHSVALTGLTSGLVYDAVVTQPGVGAAPAITGQTQFVVRFRTGPGGGPLAAGEVGMMAEATDGLAVSGAGTPVGSATPSPAGDLSAMQTAAAEEGLTLSGLLAVPNDSTSLTITWRSSAYANGSVRVEGGGFAVDIPEEGSKRMNHTLTISSLQPGTTYTITVRSTDADGRTGEAGPVEVTTDPA